jgi:hypothetical protein
MMQRKRRNASLKTLETAETENARMPTPRRPVSHSANLALVHWNPPVNIVIHSAFALTGRDMDNVSRQMVAGTVIPLKCPLTGLQMWILF